MTYDDLKTFKNDLDSLCDKLEETHIDVRRCQSFNLTEGLWILEDRKHPITPEFEAIEKDLGNLVCRAKKHLLFIGEIIDVVKDERAKVAKSI